jgi:putative ABC transport system permease protein
MRHEPKPTAALQPARWLLRLILPRGIVRESILGDLSEDYSAYLSSHPVHSATLWYWRQAIALASRYAAQRLAQWLPSRKIQTPRAIEMDPCGRRGGLSGLVAAIVQDLGFAVRLMIRSPVYSGIAVLTLALGIGANSALFSVINTVLIQPLPFEDPDRLVWMRERDLENDEWAVAYPNFADWRRENNVFEDVAAHRVSNFFLTGTDQPERVAAALVSAQLFPILGVEADKGRFFLEDEDGLDAPQVAVLGFEFWQRRFGGDPNIVGQTISLDDQNHTVVGIVPQGFLFPLNRPDVQLYMPLGTYAATRGWTNRRGTRPGLAVTARMKHGVSLEHARADMDMVAAGLEQQYPEQNAGKAAAVVPLRERVVGDMQTAFLILLAAVALVLLIACANVASLLLARASARAREIAVRKSLGAGPGRLIRQLLTESILLALVGGGAGVLLAVWGVRLLPRVLPSNLPIMYQHIGVDGLVLGISLLLSVATGLVFGVYPAFHASRQDLSGVLKQEGGTASAGGRRIAFRNALAVSEIALAAVLLISAGLVMRSFVRLTTADPGFNSDNVLACQLALPAESHGTDQELTTFYGAMEEGVGRIPGVESVGLSAPLLGGWQNAYVVEDRLAPGPGDRHMTDLVRVSPRYFRTMEVPLLQGRYFTEGDRHDTRPVAIVDQVFAEKHWPNEDPVGKRVKIATDPAASEPWLEIVGVVGHVKFYGVDRSSREELYVPLAQETYSVISFVVRTARNHEVAAATIQTVVSSLVHDRPIYDFRTMRQYLGRRSSNRRISLVLLTVFATIALLMATAGVYGVVAHSVALRSHEYGIRMAMGASAGGIHRMVILGSARLAAAGVGIGLLAAYFATSFLAGLLFGVTTRDPLTFVGVGSFLAVLTVMASVVPAFRATRGAPVAVLQMS